MKSEYIRPDSFTVLRIKEPETGDLVEFAVSPKYDRVDFFPKLGAWIIKIYDDEIGLMAVHVDEKEASRVINTCDLPLVYRDFMLESEHEAWLTAEANNLEKGWSE